MAGLHCLCYTEYIYIRLFLLEVYGIFSDHDPHE